MKVRRTIVAISCLTLICAVAIICASSTLSLIIGNSRKQAEGYRIRAEQGMRSHSSSWFHAFQRQGSLTGLRRSRALVSQIRRAGYAKAEYTSVACIAMAREFSKTMRSGTMVSQSR